jgi:glyoxalase family protein
MLLGDLFGFKKADSEGNQTLYQTDAPIGRNVIIEIADDPAYGKNGRGIVHHIAFRAEDREELDLLRHKVGKKGLSPTQIIDRHWFRSVYFRIPAGVLFEMASDDPGYTVDEEFEHLGKKLILPPWLESKRDRIEGILPDISVATKA